MKITITEEGGVPVLVIGEVFSGAFIETSEGNRMGFCLRDDTVEFSIIPKGSNETRWYRANMQTLEVVEMRVEEDFRKKALDLTNEIIEELERHHIKFEGKLTHTGRDVMAQMIVEPFLRKLVDPGVGSTEGNE